MEASSKTENGVDRHTVEIIFKPQINFYFSTLVHAAFFRTTRTPATLECFQSLFFKQVVSYCLNNG